MGDAISVVRARRLEIARAIAELQDEDKDLETAEQVLARLSGAGPGGASSGKAKSARAAGAPKPASGRPSQRALVLEVLRSSEEVWLKSGAIAQAASRLSGAPVPELSLRPLLSALKRESVIVRDGHKVALRARVGAKAHARVSARADV